MKTFFVLFTVATICFALPLESEDAAATDGTTPSPPDQPTGSPSPAPFSYTSPNTTIKNTDAPVQSSIPVHIDQGVQLTITTYKQLAALYVSVDPKNPQPSADKYDYAAFTSPDNNFTTQIQIPSNKLNTSAAREYDFSNFDAATQSPPADTSIFTTIQAISGQVTYVYEYKPLDTPKSSTSSVTVPPTTTTTTSSGIMLAPAFYNTLLLIILYNYFTFSK